VVLLGLGLLAAATAGAQPFAIVSDSDGTGSLYSINLGTGAAAALGSTGFDDVEGLAIRPSDGALFAVDDETDSLLTCSTVNGACTTVGSLGITFDDPGLAFACDGTLYLSTEGDGSPGDLYTVDTGTGAATLVGSLGGSVDGHSIAFGPPSASCASGAFVLNGNVDQPDLYCVNLATGAATLIGNLGVLVDGQPAMDFDGSGTLWVVENDSGPDILTVNTISGAATDVGYDMSGGGGFDGMAMRSGYCAAQTAVSVPLLSSLALAAFGLILAAAGVVALRLGPR